jgi:hypothetical protein
MSEMLRFIRALVRCRRRRLARRQKGCDAPALPGVSCDDYA